MGNLHLCNSACGCGRISQTLSTKNQIVGLFDFLSLGPTGYEISLEKWDAKRRHFWTEFLGKEPSNFFYLDNFTNLAENLKNRTNSNITIWQSADIYGVLFAAWCISALHSLGVSTNKIMLCQTSNYLHNQVTASQSETDAIMTMRRLWEAYASATPAPMLSLLSDKSFPPSLTVFVTKILARFPDRFHGLISPELKLLGICFSHGPTLRNILVECCVQFFDSGEEYSTYIIEGFLKKLGNYPVPLLAITGKLENVQNASIRLTDAGRDVLSGNLNSININGFNEWIGGTHVYAPDNLWHWDSEKRIFTEKEK